MDAHRVTGLCRRVVIVCSLAVAASASAQDKSPARPPINAPEIRISDVELFYRVYDAANGAPSAAALQSGYLDAGSDGVRQFIPKRIVSAEKLAETISQKREVYEQARQCAAKVPEARNRIALSLDKLVELYPEANLAPVTMLIGRANTGGTTDKSGVLIGVETICMANWLNPDFGDRLVQLVAHEYGHIQQTHLEEIEKRNDGKPTLLDLSLGEGIAELVGELTSGSIANVHVERFVRGRELEVEREFLAEMKQTEHSRWLFNGAGTADRPGDLGYWVGYRIARQYYERAKDKRAALRELLTMEDPQVILDRSGWVERVRAGR